MRDVGRWATGILLSAALFASCTCHKEVAPPPSAVPQAKSGFHASEQKPTPQAQVQAPTATPAPQAPQQMAGAEATPTTPADLPADFPKDLPVFKDAAVTQVQPLANDAHNVIFSTSGTVNDVFGFYQSKMAGSGWKVTQQFQRDKHAFISFQKGNLIANVTVAEDVRNPGKQVIAIMYEEQKPLDFDEF